MPGRPCRWRGDAGSIGLLILFMLFGLLALGLLLLTVVVDLAVTSARARTAADAAALAAMAASPLAGGDARYEGAAAALASANGARLVECCGDELLDVAVQVSIAPASTPLRAVLPAVSARAAASLAPPPPEEVAALLDTLGDSQSQGSADAAGLSPSTAGAVRLMRPTRGGITSRFGWRTHPISGDRRLHTGTDFGAARGTPIVAAADGIVVSAGPRGGYGNTVDIAHGKGVVTRYAHQSLVLVRPGQRVRQGQVIGRVGSTGNSTGPHLHFEVRVDGRPRDPARHL